MNKNTYTISNIAGGNLRTFRLTDGQISDAAIRHARACGFGGPQFGGPAGQVASDQYEIVRER